MKLRRLDPVYRCKERQRDRQRRKAARHRNGCSRSAEKDVEGTLDSVVGVDSVSGFSFAGFEDSYALVESVSQQNQVVENVLSQFDGTWGNQGAKGDNLSYLYLQETLLAPRDEMTVKRKRVLCQWQVIVMVNSRRLGTEACKPAQLRY